MRSLVRRSMTSGVEEEERAPEVLVSLTEPMSAHADGYRMLFAKIDSVLRVDEKKVVAVTSAVKGEGKTTTTANLVVVGARDFGKRCLIIDGDFSQPSVAKRFGLREEAGLIDVIAKKCPLGSAMKRGPVENLTLLPMGHRPPKENNIWTSDSIKDVLKDVQPWFDYVFIDAPPILPLFDMNLISGTVDGILIVARSGKTSEQLLAQAIRSVGSGKIIGSVLNGTKTGWPFKY